MLFEGRYSEGRAIGGLGGYRSTYDVSPDGKRFLMLKPAAATERGFRSITHCGELVRGIAPARAGGEIAPVMERWQQIESLFQEALQRPAAERDVFLRQACGGDADLLREVQSLLANHREGGNSSNGPRRRQRN